MYRSPNDPREKRTQMNGKKIFVFAILDVRNVNVVAFYILIGR
jgi:hypothetical protein